LESRARRLVGRVRAAGHRHLARSGRQARAVHAAVRAR
jgi:hypothetical protein